MELRIEIGGGSGLNRRPLRSEVPVEETWRLEDVFGSDEEWEAALKSLDAGIPAVAQYMGRLKDGPRLMAECFEAAENLIRRAAPVGLYAYLRLAEDGSNPANQAMMGRSAAMQAQIGAALAFIEPEVLSLPAGTVERYLKEEPRLHPFRRRLERILDDKPYVLTFETEAALAMLGEVMNAPQMLYERAKSSDMHFDSVVDSEGKETPVSFATYEVMLEKSPDVTLRRNAYASFTEGLKKYRNVLGGTFGTEIKKNVVMAKMRGFDSATHMFLHQQEVPIDVYENLLNIIQEECAPHMRRYVGLRKSALGLDKILYCDIEAPLDPEFDPEISYEEGARLIIDAVQVMGAEYAEIVQMALEDRWVDRVDNVGKSTGAFCAPAYDSHPYVLTTWGGHMRSVFTLAHELGHAVHSSLTARNQRLVNTEVSRVFVESPSTFNEMLLARHILSKTDDKRMRRYVLMQLLGTYYHDFVRHMLEAELLRRVYALAEKGQPITASVLSELQGEILDDYWQGLVEVDEGARLTWMRQPHYYMGLYPYTYSAGLACSTAVAQALDEGNTQEVAGRWVHVLKSGGTQKPLDLMRTAGVDLEDAGTIRGVVDYVGSIVDQVEETM